MSDMAYVRNEDGEWAEQEYDSAGLVDKFCSTHGSYQGADIPEGDCPACELWGERWGDPLPDPKPEHDYPGQQELFDDGS
jgi:hypothetical protein